MSPLCHRVATFLVAGSVVAVTGCGTDHLHMRLGPTAPDWEDASGQHFYQAVHFTEGDGTRGRMTVTFRGPSGFFEVPASFWTTQGPQNSPRGWIEVHYEATDELRAKYREAVKQLKAEAGPGDDVLKMPDELPEVERFYAEIKREAPSEMHVASETGFKLRLVRKTAQEPPQTGREL